MVEKDLVRQLELEMNQKHTFRNANLAQQYEEKLREMDEDEAAESGEENDVIDLNQYNARRSLVKRGTSKIGGTFEDGGDGKLLTSRGMNNDQNNVDAANQFGISPLKSRSIRNPDFIRQSLLSARQSSLILPAAEQ